ncbi:hypothetical protein [Devosia elaeis]|uniref:Phage tail assembly protein n=1 Tax=Devosia elaeis TaxID=1770058 RepID=A0A178HNY7_9HYPH|nr:hypothetical protein [Devosia elaeis]OAM73765.1 hypothetical protein A3840_17375 [Devosia elaeis]
MTDKTEDKTAPASAAPAGVKTVTLPSSGKVATIRKGKGKDMRLAARHVNPAQDPIGYAMALAAQLTEIDGNPVLPEELDEMEMDDVGAIMSALPGKSLPQEMLSRS